MQIAMENIIANFHCKQRSRKNVIVFHETTVSTKLSLKKSSSLAIRLEAKPQQSRSF